MITYSTLLTFYAAPSAPAIGCILCTMGAVVAFLPLLALRLFYKSKPRVTPGMESPGEITSLPRSCYSRFLVWIKTSWRRLCCVCGCKHDKSICNRCNHVSEQYALRGPRTGRLSSSKANFCAGPTKDKVMPEVPTSAIRTTEWIGRNVTSVALGRVSVTAIEPASGCTPEYAALCARSRSLLSFASHAAPMAKLYDEVRAIESEYPAWQALWKTGQDYPPMAVIEFHPRLGYSAATPRGKQPPQKGTLTGIVLCFATTDGDDAGNYVEAVSIKAECLKLLERHLGETMSESWLSTINREVSSITDNYHCWRVTHEFSVADPSLMLVTFVLKLGSATTKPTKPAGQVRPVESSTAGRSFVGLKPLTFLRWRANFTSAEGTWIVYAKEAGAVRSDCRALLGKDWPEITDGEIPTWITAGLRSLCRKYPYWTAESRLQNEYRCAGKADRVRLIVDFVCYPSPVDRSLIGA